MQEIRSRRRVFLGAVAAAAAGGAVSGQYYGAGAQRMSAGGAAGVHLRAVAKLDADLG